MGTNESDMGIISLDWAVGIAFVLFLVLLGWRRHVRVRREKRRQAVERAKLEHPYYLGRQLYNVAYHIFESYPRIVPVETLKGEAPYELVLLVDDREVFRITVFRHQDKPVRLVFWHHEKKVREARHFTEEPIELDRAKTEIQAELGAFLDGLGLKKA